MARGKKKTVEEVANAYKKARLQASEQDSELSTVEKASYVLGINREKLGQIEQEDPCKQRSYPDADEVASMIDHYRAPELRNYYCTNICPLGTDMPKLQYENLSAISLQLVLALQRIALVQERLGDILEDGQVSDAEKEEFCRILKNLKTVASQVDSLELWAQKNGIVTDES